MTDNSDEDEEEPVIDWVTYQGEVWRVDYKTEKDILWLKKSGFSKIVHKVHLSKVQIGGYK